MSTMRMFTILKNGDLLSSATFDNSFRGAPIIWEWMENTWLPAVMFSRTMGLSDREKEQELWDLARNENVPLHHRITIASTFDSIMVKRENVALLIKAFTMTSNDMRKAGQFDAYLERNKKIIHNMKKHEQFLCNENKENFFSSLEEDFKRKDDPGLLLAQANELKKMDVDDAGVCWQKIVSANAWGNNGLAPILHHNIDLTKDTEIEGKIIPAGSSLEITIYQDRAFNIFKDVASPRQYWMFDDYFKKGYVLEDLDRK